MNRQVLRNLDNITTALDDPEPEKANMLADNSIHLIHADQPRHEHARTPPRPISKHRSAGSAPGTGRSKARRYLTDNAPATAACASALKSPTAATANSPTRTGGYAANSRAPLADFVLTPGDTCG